VPPPAGMRVGGAVIAQATSAVFTARRVTGAAQVGEGPTGARTAVAIARDIHGMTLGDMVGAAAEGPGNNAAGQGVTYALENL